MPPSKERDDEREKFDLREQARLNWDNANGREPAARAGLWPVAVAVIMMLAVVAALALFD